MLIAALALLTTASAQDLTLGGDCPGVVMIEATGITPGASVMIVTGDRAGSTAVPAAVSSQRIPLVRAERHREVSIREGHGRQRLREPQRRREGLGRGVVEHPDAHVVRPHDRDSRGVE